ncbi:unnamed protein product [marine sediment metagenome]|uniref:C2H2-type domain-containing protein n=1 Tax=marine sediment metagenome TaxID=412755 RepID=X1LPA3_9ZZZZ
MDKRLIAIIGVVLGLGIAIGVIQAMQPTLAYTCPICGVGFVTYDELYQHFTIEHPAEPIDIIWE